MKRNTQHNSTRFRFLLCWVPFILIVTNKPFILSVVMLSFIMLSVIMLSFITLSVAALCSFCSQPPCLSLFSLMFVSKAGAYPSKSPFRFYTSLSKPWTSYAKSIVKRHRTSLQSMHTFISNQSNLIIIFGWMPFDRKPYGRQTFGRCVQYIKRHVDKMPLSWLVRPKL